MQLRYYFAILQRFWLLIVVLPLIVGLVSLVVALGQSPRYASVARLLLTQAPYQSDQVLPFPDFNLSYSWESSTFILDDLPQVIRSKAFREDVSLWLKSKGYEIEPDDIQSGLDATTFHRTVTLSSSADDPEMAVKLIEGAIASLQSHGLKYWDRATTDSSGLRVAVLDPASEATSLRTTRRLVIDVGLRVGLAFAAAIGLSFLLHYLDDTLRRPQQAEEWMGVQVLGVIPKE